MSAEQPPRLTFEALTQACDVLPKRYRRTVVVHPDDVNLADTKAAAAEHNATVVSNPYCPRGQVLILTQDLRDPWEDQ